MHGVVAVIERRSELLAIRRAEGIKAAGFWCFPGGAIEAGETTHEAVVREVREEVGLAVRPVRQVWEWLHPDGKLHLSWWLARLEDEDQAWDLSPQEVAEARWITPERFRHLHPLLESNLQFLRAYRGFAELPPGQDHGSSRS